MPLKTFEDVHSKLDKLGYKLSTSKEEFYHKRRGNINKCVLQFQCSRCNVVYERRYQQACGQQPLCKKCVLDKISKQMKANSSLVTSNDVEFDGYKLVENILLKSMKIDIVRLTEHTKADFLVKPNSLDTDTWLQVQLKATMRRCTIGNRYKFSFKGNDYENMLILCVCVEDKKVWFFTTEQVTVKHTLSISERNSLENANVEHGDIPSKILWYYEHLPKVSYLLASTPITEQAKQEAIYKEQRRNHIPWFDSLSPNRLATTIDFCYVFNGIVVSVQEKVAHRKRNAYEVHLHHTGPRGLNRKQTKIPYKIGECQFYWIHLANNRTFFVFPESELVSKGYIDAGNGQAIAKTMFLHDDKKYMKSYMWTADYMFDYKQVDKPRLVQLLFNV